MDLRRERHNIMRLFKPESNLYLELVQVLGIRGRVIDFPEGRPVSGASVEPRIAYIAEERRYPTAQRAVIADGEGRFSVPALNSTIVGGKLTLWSPDGGSSREVLINPQELREDLDLGDIPLHEGKAPTLLSLLVRDLHGSPIKGAVGMVAGTSLRSSPTDANGRTSLRGVVPGESIVCVGAIGFSSAELTASATRSSEMEVILEGACSLEVHVRSSDGEVAKGVRIMLSSSGNLFDADQRGLLAALHAGASAVLPESIDGSTRAESIAKEGRVLFNALIPGHPLQLEVHGRFGGLVAQEDVPPLGPEEHRIVEMTAAVGRFCGRVLDKRSQPLQGANVKVRDVTLLPMRGGGASFATDEAGEFCIDGLGVTEIELDVAMPGYTPARFRCEVRGDCAPVVLVLMPSDRRVLVHVRDAEGRAVDAVVWAELSTGARVYAVTVGPCDFSLADLPADKITVRAIAYEHMYVLPHDPTVPELTLVLLPSGEVRIAATAPTDPGGYVFVHLLPYEEANWIRSEQLMVPAGATGAVTFLGVRPGRYDAVVRRLRLLSWDGEHDWVESSRRVALDVQKGEQAYAELFAD
jgi:hypothetical protein